jgi:hypothetical protein
MLSRAKRRLDDRDQHRVTWVNDTHHWLYTPDAPLPLTSDQTEIVFTAFFFDVLPEGEYRALLRWSLERSHAILWIDFIPHQSWWGDALIRFMYACFWLTTKIEQRRLLDHKQLFEEEGWSRSKASGISSFASGLIEAVCFTPKRLKDQPRRRELRR